MVFQDEAHLQRIIRRVVGLVGRHVDETSPMVDARLADGSRFNAVIPPLALDGSLVSIRRFGSQPLKIGDLIAKNAVTPEMVQFMEACTKARINTVVSGGTGSGKTTLLNALSAFIPPDERIVTIEDAAELRLQQRHVVRMECRASSSEGTGLVTTRDLVRNALRMRPDRIIVGECRGPETLDMLQAMNTGHAGSMTTIHANDTRDALSRMEMMVGMAGFELPMWIIRRQIASAVQIIIQAARLSGGPARSSRSRKSPEWKGTSSACKTSLSSARAAWMGRARPRGNSPPRGFGPTSSTSWRERGFACLQACSNRAFSTATEKGVGQRSRTGPPRES